nr:L-type lectin-domain containing receptor kinase IX.1-like [Tanacetum cinerariifolium]
KVTDKAGENSDLWLVQWVWDLLGMGELLSGVDQMLSQNFDKLEVECLMMVGLWCVHPDQSMRPSILQVIQVLKFESSLPSLPMKMPVPMYLVEPVSPEVISTATMTNSSLDQVR